VALGGVFAVLLFRYGRAGERSRWAAAVVLSLLVAAGLPGHDRFWSAVHGARPGTAIIAEDGSSVVSLQSAPGRDAIMRVNGIGHSSIPYWEIWALLAALPVLAHGEARSALVIGMGTGTTPWAMARMPGMDRIDLYEIARPEREALARWQARAPRPEIAEFLESPRIRIWFGDGRLALRLSPARYDVIEADATEPYIAYSGNLYSVEFFQEVRSRLSTRGIFCTYVPTPRVADTMRAVFPAVLDVQAGDVRIMLGSEKPLAVSTALIEQRLRSPQVIDAFGTTPYGAELLERLRGLMAGVRFSTVRPADVRSEDDLNRDLFPRDEFDWRWGRPD
jgi:spermidine synthase